MKMKKDNCPICNHLSRAENQFFPFCSSRCQLIDLGNWLGEQYHIPGDTMAPSKFLTEESHSVEELDSLNQETV